MHENAVRGLTVERQKQVPIVYKGHTLATPLRLDLLVNGLVIVECKATTQQSHLRGTASHLPVAHKAQARARRQFRGAVG